MTTELPPGQVDLGRFPRFGTTLGPPPAVPAAPTLSVSGAVSAPFTLALDDLGPRRELRADLHCVSGWSATRLRWEGADFARLYRERIAPLAAPGVTHLLLRSLDGYAAYVTLEDALSGDVLLADRLNGGPLDGDHGAPLRFVTPGQYGFVNVKHLCGIELHTRRPREHYGTLATVVLRLAGFVRHDRARVWEEERHRFLPPRAVRGIYRLFIAPTKKLSGIRARGRSASRGRRD